MITIGILGSALFAQNRHAAREQDRLTEVRAQLRDGNFSSRVDFVKNASKPPMASSFVRLGQALTSVISSAEDRATANDYAWLKARVLAELWVLFRYAPSQAPLSELVERLGGSARSTNDQRVTLALIDLENGRINAAQKRLEGDLAQATPSADTLWLMALIERRQGRLAQALDYAERAVRVDSGHPHAGPLQVHLLAESPGVDPTLALKKFKRLAEVQRPDHIGARIGYETQQIIARKRPQEAAQRLSTILGFRSALVSPYHRAAIHLALGKHDLLKLNFKAARDALTTAVELAPGLKRFVMPLVALDLRTFRIDDAERSLAEFKDDTSIDVLELRTAIDLLRGRFQDAEKRLSGVALRSPRLDYLRGEVLLGRRAFVSASERTDVADAIAARNAFGRALEQSDGWVAANIQKVRAEGLAGINGQSARRTLKANRRAMPVQSSWDAVLGHRTLSFRAYGDVLGSQGQQTGAAAQYVNAFEIDERDYRAAWALCRLHTTALRARQAIHWCKKTLINKSFEPARRQLIEVARAYGDMGAVIAAIEPRHADQQASNWALRRLAHAYDTLNLEEKLTALTSRETSPLDAPTRAYVQGLILRRQNRLKKAEAEFATASRALAHDEDVQVAYAKALMRRGRTDKAIAKLREMMDGGAKSQGALLLARATLEVGQVNAALSAARTAHQLARRELSHPRIRAEAMALEARAHLYKGGRSAQQKAARLIVRALRIEPDLPAGLLARGMLAESRRQYDKARRLFARLVEVKPDSVEGLFRYGRLLLRNDVNRALARRIFQDVQRLDPDGRWGDRARKLVR
ncbi:MAG: tetratricopeptide repeat protein [Myxococcota bacterium]|nr:tetratricopeptide repeat protein [Myxococcota bacterium]